MKVGLYNLEPKYKNLALEKLRLYHQGLGDEVEDYLPLAYESYNKIYCSSIFAFTPKSNLPPNAICGGTGFDLTTKLPPEVEAIKPHLNFGYTTRGCIRDCPFCVVRQKEGYVSVVGDLLDLWDGKTKDIQLLDNNNLAIPEHFELIAQQALEHKLRIDITQGLDHRLLNPDNVALLAAISHKEYHFAYDSPAYKPSVERAIKLLKDAKIKRSTWYVLVGFNTTFQEDLDRLNFLRDNGQSAYVQRYKRSPEYISLAAWANQHQFFNRMTWEEFKIARAER